MINDIIATSKVFFLIENIGIIKHHIHFLQVFFFYDLPVRLLGFRLLIQRSVYSQPVKG